MMESCCFFVFQLTHVFTILSAFNIDIDKPLIFFGPKDDQFGYSTEILKNDHTIRILVGAPNKDYGNQTGVLYSCAVNLLNSQTNATPSTCSIIRSKMDLSKRFATTVYKADKNILVCSPLREHAHDMDMTTGGCEVFSANLTKLTDIYVRAKINETKAKGMYGFSLTSDSHNHKKVVLGGPNACESDGGLASTDIEYGTLTYYNDNDYCDSPITGTYLGFTLDSLPFKTSNYYVVGKPGFANEDGLIGMIEVVELSSSITKKILKKFPGKQLGGGFGQSLCVMDADGDNLMDIIVGAPLEYINLTSSSEIIEDVGRIYIFFGDSEKIIEDTGIYKNRVSGDPIRFSRFGTALSAIGDINDDNSQDLAVGAPFDDEMRGAVYIFNGCSRDCVKKWTYSQKIKARAIHKGLQGFGSYISRAPEDIDNNEFRDIAVGSYRTGGAVVLRSRPVIFIHPVIYFHPNPVPLNSSNVECSQGNDYPCLDIKVCFNVSGKGIPVGTYINFTLHGDISTSTPRIHLNGNESFIEIINFLVMKNNLSCTTVTGYVSDVGPMFFLNLHEAMVFNVNFSLSGKVVKREEVVPILRKDAVVSQTSNVTFKSSCLKEEDCHPYFTGNINTRENRYIGKSETFKLDLYIANHGDPATQTVIQITSDTPVEMTFFETHDKSEKMECKNVAKVLIECKIRSDPFYQHQIVNGTLDFTLDPKTSGAKGYVGITVDTRYIASGQVHNTSVSVGSAHVQRISAVSVGSEPSEEQREVDIGILSLTHKVTFSMDNKGPSAVSGLLLQIGVPMAFHAVDIIYGIMFNKKLCNLMESPNAFWKVGAEIPMQTDIDINSENPDASSEDIRCSNPRVQCHLLECKVKQLDVEMFDKVSLEVNISDKIVNMLETVKVLNYVISAKLNLSEDSEFKGQLKVENSETILTLVPKEFKFVSTPIDLGVVIGGSVGGFAFLCLLGIALWKAGFFERKKRQEVEEYKRRTAILKRQSRMSKLSAIARKEITVSG